jgi:hypothetical protein
MLRYGGFFEGVEEDEDDEDDEETISIPGDPPPEWGDPSIDPIVTGPNTEVVIPPSQQDQGCIPTHWEEITRYEQVTTVLTGVVTRTFVLYRDNCGFLKWIIYTGVAAPPPPDQGGNYEESEEVDYTYTPPDVGGIPPIYSPPLPNPVYTPTIVAKASIGWYRVIGVPYAITTYKTDAQCIGFQSQLSVYKGLFKRTKEDAENQLRIKYASNLAYVQHTLVNKEIAKYSVNDCAVEVEIWQSTPYVYE